MTKRFKQFMSALVLAALVLSLTGQVVKAATMYEDPTPYNFYFDAVAGDVYDYGAMQPKTDASSARVIYDSSDGNRSFTATIIGATLYGEYRENIQLYSRSIEPSDVAYRIYNWVYENDLPYAILRGESDYDTIYTSSGRWYADWDWNN